MTANTCVNMEKILEDHAEERTQCEVWSRVMGYLQSTARFNQGKVGEFNERKFFREPKASDPVQH